MARRPVLPVPDGYSVAMNSTRSTPPLASATPSPAEFLVRVGHSPDPDDAFMFYALAAAKIDTGRYRFVHELVDIETLNRRAFDGELELTALSIHAYAHLADRYLLCPCGASMGDGYGPIVVAKEPLTQDLLAKATIAVPGTLTSAFLALSLWLGREFKHVVVPFDQILDVVAAGHFAGQPIDAGLVIHEGQLTYREQNLELVVDLGVWWKARTDLPLPLGANGIRRSRSRGNPRYHSTAVREHPVGSGSPRGIAPVCDAVGTEPGQPTHRYLCGHVRQRLDVRFWHSRPRLCQAVPR